MAAGAGTVAGAALLPAEALAGARTASSTGGGGGAADLEDAVAFGVGTGARTTSSAGGGAAAAFEEAAGFAVGAGAVGAGGAGLGLAALANDIAAPNRPRKLGRVSAKSMKAGLRRQRDSNSGQSGSPAATCGPNTPAAHSARPGTRGLRSGWLSPARKGKTRSWNSLELSTCASTCPSGLSRWYSTSLLRPGRRPRTRWNTIKTSCASAARESGTTMPAATTLMLQCPLRPAVPMTAAPTAPISDPMRTAVVDRSEFECARCGF
jgi:hypothetical protein